MNTFMVPAGEYLQLCNMTDRTINDLYFTYGDYSITKARKIEANARENFMIATANLPKDYDLVFYFKDDVERKMIFKEAVKKMTKDNMWSYFFGKIIEKEGMLVIEEDPEGKDLYFSSQQWFKWILSCDIQNWVVQLFLIWW